MNERGLPVPAGLTVFGHAVSLHRLPRSGCAGSEAVAAAAHRRGCRADSLPGWRADLCECHCLPPARGDRRHVGLRHPELKLKQATLVVLHELVS